MTHDDFNKIFEMQVARCRELLVIKGQEDSPGDRFHNFNVAGALQGETPERSLGGMLAKHIVSIYDMIESPDPSPIEKWDEKITDAMNYLFLLRGIVEEIELRRISISEIRLESKLCDLKRYHGFHPWNDEDETGRGQEVMCPGYDPMNDEVRGSSGDYFPGKNPRG